jgi:hypothetical protein
MSGNWLLGKLRGPTFTWLCSDSYNSSGYLSANFWCNRPTCVLELTGQPETQAGFTNFLSFLVLKNRWPYIGKQRAPHPCGHVINFSATKKLCTCREEEEEEDDMGDGPNSTRANLR